MKSGTIYNYGDAFSIAYVMPSKEGVNEVDIHFSCGGTLLFEYVIANFPIFSEENCVVRSVKKVTKGRSHGNRQFHLITLPSTAPAKGHRGDAPLRISYYVKQEERDDGSEGPWLMADTADRPAMLNVRGTSSGRPEIEKWKASKYSDCDVFFERITEWKREQIWPKGAGPSCRYWVRSISPVNGTARPFPEGNLRKVVGLVQEGACVIVSAQQLAVQMCVRLQSSYEAMVVDLVRYWNWSEAEGRERFASLFDELSPSKGPRRVDPLDRLVERMGATSDDASRELFVVCRLPGGALLVYGGKWELSKVKGQKSEQTNKSQSDPTDPQTFEPKASLIFDRRRPADIRRVGGGVAKGTGMLVAACIVKALVRTNLEDSANSFREKLFAGTKEALRITTMYLKQGVACVIDSYDEQSRPSKKSAIEGLKEELDRERGEEARAGNSVYCQLPLTIETIRSRETLWSIVNQTLERLVDPTELQSARESKVNEEQDFHTNERILYLVAGRHLLASSPKKAAGGAEPTLSASKKVGTAPILRKLSAKQLFKAIPVVTFGKLELIDREEIQDYLAMQSILLNYLESRPSKPLNLGVFGPPGSGKSFGTKELLQHVGKGGNTFQSEPNEFNLSQFRSLEDLGQALHMIRDEGLRRTMPVAFFDEFDTTFQGNPYGWLQYLLAPMQDGKFWDKGREYTLGRCVLVFAGGVNRRFAEMNGRLRDPGFCAAKGPDFISRLRGVLNIKGVNRPEEHSDQGRYLLRRAVLLRSMVARIHKDAGAPVPEPLMDAAAAEALLKIDGFRHGNRSMEAILRMSHLQPGKTLRSADLPPLEQLEIHVDGKHFTEIVKGKFRGETKAENAQEGAEKDVENSRI